MAKGHRNCVRESRKTKIGWYHVKQALFVPYRDERRFLYCRSCPAERTTMERSIYCGALRDAHIGKTVTAMGWVQTKRDMGGVIFIDLRDREGVLQVVFDQRNLSRRDFNTAEGLKNEYVIAVTGVIGKRDEETYNPRIATGTVELRAKEIKVLSEAQPLPFPIEDDMEVREDLRLKYRYLDIRRPRMFRALKFRNDTVMAFREYLDQNGFIEVETPILTKSTPEGARDYLVPSRVHPGAFYALPQSPQQFKQLLMVGGVDRYYQIARCFRDEDLRADRQPEFTQLDIELSFTPQEGILQLMEGIVRCAFDKMLGITFPGPFPRLTWQEAMDRYGSDKPDLRFGLPIVDLSELVSKCSFAVFRRVVDQGGAVRAISVPGGADFTRTAIEELTRKAAGYGAKGMAWIAVREDGGLYSILTKYFKPEELDSIVKAMDAGPGDFILFCADKIPVICKVLGSLRLDVGEMLGLRKKDDFKCLIVTDFPQFEYSEEEKRYVAMHHPFTMPYEEDIPYLLTDPARVRAQAYDIVLNGTELGGGSIRIHRKDVQKLMFKALGFSDEETERRFGFMINAFSYGAPPHGGFAIGLDRFVMLMLGANSLRDIIAFPKTKDASCLMTNAPDLVDAAQLETLRLHQTSEVAFSGRKKTRALAAADVDNVAELAKLRLTPEEKATMSEEMGAIIAFADRLGGIDTKDVPITAHVIPVSNVFREDIAARSPDRDLLLVNAPSREEGYVYIPKVVE